MVSCSQSLSQCISGPVLAPPPAYLKEDIGTVEICALGGTVTVPVVLNTSTCTNDCFGPTATEDKTCGSGSEEGWCFSDYIGLNETFTIGPGERRCFTITIVDDLRSEESEQVYISLKAVPPHVLSTGTSFQIADNDGMKESVNRYNTPQVQRFIGN